MCMVNYSKTPVYNSAKKFENFDFKSPRWAYIEITNRCDHACSWCYGEFSTSRSDFISVEDFLILCEKLTYIGVTQLTLSGGEPTLHPRFDEILAIATSRFDTHITTHGDWGSGTLDQIRASSVNQIQFNFQGSKWHDRIHQVEGAYERMVSNFSACVEIKSLEVVGSITVGAYNFGDFEDIVAEVDSLNPYRIRVWEAAGYGNAFRKTLTVRDVFSKADEVIKSRGFIYTLSYDPEYTGDIGVPCPALAKMHMYIDVKGNVIFCGAVPSTVAAPSSNLLMHDADEVLQRYSDYADMMRSKRDAPYCPARADATSNESVVRFFNDKRN
jgi:MoaA/NifB/PqqE/SkfB family radical SAM enzyme